MTIIRSENRTNKPSGRWLQIQYEKDPDLLHKYNAETMYTPMQRFANQTTEA
jgi:hypothetical protein